MLKRVVAHQPRNLPGATCSYAINGVCNAVKLCQNLNGSHVNNDSSTRRFTATAAAAHDTRLYFILGLWTKYLWLSQVNAMLESPPSFLRIDLRIYSTATLFIHVFEHELRLRTAFNLCCNNNRLLVLSKPKNFIVLHSPRVSRGIRMTALIRHIEKRVRMNPTFGFTVPVASH